VRNLRPTGTGTSAHRRTGTSRRRNGGRSAGTSRRASAGTSRRSEADSVALYRQLAEEHPEATQTEIAALMDISTRRLRDIQTAANGGTDQTTTA
jgi:hypothetical protein